MNHLERSQLEIGIIFDSFPSNDQSPRTATKHVAVAMLSEQLKSLDRPSSILFLPPLIGKTNRDEGAQYDAPSYPSEPAPLAATQDLDAFVDALSRLGLHNSGDLLRHRRTEYPAHTRLHSCDENLASSVSFPPTFQFPLQPTHLIGGNANAWPLRTASFGEWLSSWSPFRYDVPSTTSQSSSPRPVPLALPATDSSAWPLRTDSPQKWLGLDTLRPSFDYDLYFPMDQSSSRPMLRTLPTDLFCNLGATPNADLTTCPLARRLQPLDKWVDFEDSAIIAALAGAGIPPRDQAPTCAPSLLYTKCRDERPAEWLRARLLSARLRGYSDVVDDSLPGSCSPVRSDDQPPLKCWVPSSVSPPPSLLRR
ncbi:hypothetical protein EDB89DRAFT_708112 [Lactarius sanguifluus]|nr:hypothetical protein EDB89DRAFT_708112 [Lactarius sanguifluus]